MEAKALKLTELAELVHGEVVGDQEVSISGVADLDSAGDGDITFLVDPRKSQKIIETGASAVIVPDAVDKADKPIIRVKNPYLAIALIHNRFYQKPFAATGVHPKAVVGKDCQIPAEIAIGPMVVIGERVKLGRRVTLHPGVVIGDDVSIGDDTVIHANVTIGFSCELGARVIIHSGTVIGSDGFGYATDEQGRHIKRPHVGIVQIDDDVEIGANVTVDRATFGKTWIQQGTKIDNLVQLGHNVVVGAYSLLVAQVGIAGSTRLGNWVVMGGQVGVGGHLQIGDRVMVAAKSGIHNNQDAGVRIAGIPAIPHKKWLRASTAFAKLPDLIKEVRELKKKVADLCRKL